MLYLDTETCGLTGPIVLIQTAVDNEAINLWDVWHNPVQATLALLEEICDHDVCAFNLSFDWFHINKLYNLLVLCKDPASPPDIAELADISATKPNTFCLKPKRSLDLFLTARKGEYQTLMARRNIRIKKVPKDLAHDLKQILDTRITFPDIYFARRPNKAYGWEIEDSPDETGAGFYDLCLKFAPSSGLKPLIKEIFGEDTFDGKCPDTFDPEESSYNPYDTGWETVIHHHIKHWRDNKRARTYAENDVHYLRRLYKKWRPELDDDDSNLAACVGAVRWKGYSIDSDAIEREVLKTRVQTGEFLFTHCNYNSPPASKRWLHVVASDVQKLVIPDTSKKTLETLKDWEGDVGERVRKLIAVRKRDKKRNVLLKLKETDRFCPDFKVIGTKSGRMSGGSDLGIAGGSLNPQGMQRDPRFRELFSLASSPDKLSGGDFEQFEVTIADATYDDENLHAQLKTGKKFPAVLGTLLYDESYDEVMSSKGTDSDHYTPAKNTTYGLFYGAAAKKLAETAGIPEERSQSALDNFFNEYPNVRKSREAVFDAFCSMRQPGGIGTEIVWREPAAFIESLLGFRRYFTLENKITRAIFELARNLPDHVQADGMVSRRAGRVQTKRGAIQSALYATAFQIQAQNMRAAANHVIQSTGATITKHLQRRIWDLQPVGVHRWQVQPMNIHDEVMVVHHPYQEAAIQRVVVEVIEKYRKVVPLLSIGWKTDLKDWSGK